jgi:uncharacterized protein (TIGR02145 family)
MKNIALVWFLFSITNVSLIAQGTFIDSRDGKIYRTIIIGQQEWMAENLNFMTEAGSWCYDDSNANCETGGRFYNFEAAQNVCMEGWHLPSREEFDALLTEAKKNGSTYDYLLQKQSFSALMNGWRGINEHYYGRGSQERFWSSTGWTGMNAWYLSIESSGTLVTTEHDSKYLGFSVRCVRNRQLID